MVSCNLKHKPIVRECDSRHKMKHLRFIRKDLVIRELVSTFSNILSIVQGISTTRSILRTSSFPSKPYEILGSFSSCLAPEDSVSARILLLSNLQGELRCTLKLIALCKKLHFVRSKKLHFPANTYTASCWQIICYTSRTNPSSW
jgi:hypothetical protein